MHFRHPCKSLSTVTPPTEHPPVALSLPAGAVSSSPNPFCTSMYVLTGGEVLAVPYPWPTGAARKAYALSSVNTAVNTKVAVC